MPFDPKKHKGRLRRLDASAYQGLAWVHWTMGIEGRHQGWLDDLHHRALREILLHAMVRQDLICPVYCLMPDHTHFLIGGLSEESDQKPAIKFLRQQWNRLLVDSGDYSLQSQAYDHVLDEKERPRKKFETTANYMLENPVRSKLVDSPKEWQFLGSMVPGYPHLSPVQEGFWDLFWKLYHREIDDSKD